MSKYNALMASFILGDVSEAADIKALGRSLRTHERGINAFLSDLDKMEGKDLDTSIRRILASFKLNSSNKAGLDFDAAMRDADAVRDIAVALRDDAKTDLFKTAKVKTRDNFIKCGELASYVKLCDAVIAACSGLKLANVRLSDVLAAVA